MVVQIDCEHCGRLYVDVDDLKLIDLAEYARAVFEECKECDLSEGLLRLRGIPACPLCACPNIEHKPLAHPDLTGSDGPTVYEDEKWPAYQMWVDGWFGAEDDEA